MAEKKKGYGISMADCLEQSRLKPKIVVEKRIIEKELVPIQIEKNGVLSTEYEVHEVDITLRNKGMKARDFNLTNLLAVGATDMLKPVKLTSNDVDSVISGVETISNVLDSYNQSEVGDSNYNKNIEG